MALAVDGRLGALGALGYAFVAGQSGDPSDLVLRQTCDLSRGFEWKGQDHYDAVGAAVTAWAKDALGTVAGLTPVKIGPATCWVSPAGVGAEIGTATPRLLLVCGSMPGGSCGIWGRSLCINASTLEGAMFDYIRRAHERGWVVIVADPFGDPGSPHRHMLGLSKKFLKNADTIMIVGHSYGAAMSLGMLKGDPGVQPRVAALALTDGMVWGAGGWSSANLLDERPPTDAEIVATGEPASEAARKDQRDRLAGYAMLAPMAFQPGTAKDRAFVQSVGRNWIASSLPVGAREHGTGGIVSVVSAGHESHPSTTFAATEDVFAFLDRGARRRKRKLDR